MEVRFERTGQRRYAVAVVRSQHGDLRMDPAPGYSELIPHDLVHLVVEEEFGLQDGIFGQLAAGGNAGTFVPTEELRTKAWARQVERRNRSTGTDMGDRRTLLPRSTRAGCGAAATFPAATMCAKTLRRPTSATLTSIG